MHAGFFLPRPEVKSGQERANGQRACAKSGVSLRATLAMRRSGVPRRTRWARQSRNMESLASVHASRVQSRSFGLPAVLKARVSLDEPPALPVPLDFRKPAPQDFPGGDDRHQDHLIAVREPGLPRLARDRVEEKLEKVVGIKEPPSPSPMSAAAATPHPAGRPTRSRDRSGGRRSSFSRHLRPHLHSLRRQLFLFLVRLRSKGGGFIGFRLHCKNGV